jgi:hypothetical protein
MPEPPENYRFRDYSTYVIPLESPESQESPELRERVFFGRGGLAVCLTVIGILSLTTFMFIGLYLDKL